MKTPENTPMNDCPLKNYCYLCSHNHGVVLEWLKRHAWKACIPQKGIPSSNLGHSANNQRQKSRKHTCLRDFLPFAPPPRKRGSPQTQSPQVTARQTFLYLNRIAESITRPIILPFLLLVEMMMVVDYVGCTDDAEEHLGECLEGPYHHGEGCGIRGVDSI